MKIGDALVRIHHRDIRACRINCFEIRLDGCLLIGGQRLNLSVEVAQAVFHIDTQFGDCASVFFKNIFVEDLDGVAEDDRVRNLHHGSLHMQREQHATFFGSFNLLGQETA